MLRLLTSFGFENPIDYFIKRKKHNIFRIDSIFNYNQGQLDDHKPNISDKCSILCGYDQKYPKETD